MNKEEIQKDLTEFLLSLPFWVKDENDILKYLHHIKYRFYQSTRFKEIKEEEILDFFIFTDSIYEKCNPLTIDECFNRNSNE